MESGLQADTAVERVIRQMDHEEPVTDQTAHFPGDRINRGQPVTFGSQSRRDRGGFACQNLRRFALDNAKNRLARMFGRIGGESISSGIASMSGITTPCKIRCCRVILRHWKSFKTAARTGQYVIGGSGLATTRQTMLIMLSRKYCTRMSSRNEVANWLIGSGKSSGKQGTTFGAIRADPMKATGNNPELAKSIQGAIWDTLSERQETPRQGYPRICS